MPERIERLAAKVAEAGLDWLLVSAPLNVRWLTGFTGSNGVALCPADPGRNPAVLLTDFRYTEQVAAQAPSAWQIEIASNDLLGAGLAESFPVPDSGGDSYGTVGYDDKHLTVAQLAALETAFEGRATFEPLSGSVEALRLIKSAAEVEKIRAAVQLADAAMIELLEGGLIGRSEVEVALILESAMRRLGAQELSFPPIVAAGAHGALPHAEPREVEIEQGQMVTIDWGAKLDGYCSDCTRTYFTGEVDDQQSQIYDLVLEAQIAGAAAVRPGPSGREVDSVARVIIEKGGYGDKFGHGLGHGVGLDVHEAPRLSRHGDAALEAGMIVTVEPGIYLAGECGVRIEDLLLITADRSEALNGLPKERQLVS
ncbi:MAG: Xaa-Pro peptidase family protein [Solirubrobacterales bacterium]|nr:Xaa-Pro peptidase family protein [Solirubrobacterales bacterium]